MDTRHLKAFLRIAETRSISRAAVSLGIAQPSLSQMLLRLEEEIDVQLFSRTPRGVTLTEAGRVFQEHARQLLHGLEQAKQDVQLLKTEASGSVIFVVPPSVARLIGVPLVDAMAAHAPHVSMRLVEAYSAAALGWLEDARIDLAIMYNLGPLRHLSARPLLSEELYLVGPPGHFPGEAGSLASIPASSLGDYPLVTSGPQHGIRRLLEQEAAKRGFTLDVALNIDALHQVLALVETGHGFSVLPMPAVAEAVAAGKLSVVRIGKGDLRRSLCLVRNPAQMVTHASVSVEHMTVRVIADLIESGAWDARLETEIH